MRWEQKKIKVTDMATLDQEVARLKHRCRQLEKQLDERVGHVRANYAVMAVNSVLPGLKDSSIWGVASALAKEVWSSKRLKSFLTSALVTVLEFVAVRWGIKLFTKRTRPRKKTSPSAAAEGG